jgi:hypothetical protein
MLLKKIAVIIRTIRMTLTYYVDRMQSCGMVKHVVLLQIQVTTGLYRVKKRISVECFRKPTGKAQLRRSKQVDLSLCLI